MSSLQQTLLLTTMAGLAIPVGALLARIEQIKPQWLEEEFRHSVIAFGGGILISAVALVLVPEGVKELSLSGVIAAFLAGGAVFYGIEYLLERSKGAMSQLAAMLSDFVPEAIALGAAFAGGGEAGLLLAVLITLQNLPEGFNAYREMADGDNSWSRTKITGVFFLLVPLGPVAGFAGHEWLSSYPAVIGFIMLFAASGILYLTFQDLAPQAKLEKRNAPALGAVLGFLFGLVGQQLIG
ncbi:MAG: hypothetical protein MI807_02150 [Verrucomicrobiales bacterium]|nr:hypothetical protein [Verrucomicrobiales bacterium]